jgi:hypothetical protein
MQDPSNVRIFIGQATMSSLMGPFRWSLLSS